MTEDIMTLKVSEDVRMRCCVCKQITDRPEGIVFAQMRHVSLNREARIANINITEMCDDCSAKVQEFIEKTLTVEEDGDE